MISIAMWDGAILLILLEWAVRLSMIPLVARNRRPSTAMAWLAVIFFQPFLGLFIYLLIGENRLPRNRIRELAALRRRLQLDSWEAIKPFQVDPFEQDPERPRFLLPVRLGEFPILGGNESTLISDTQATIEHLIHDIDHAQDHVHFLFYIFEDDETGKQILDALERAVTRGVTCRLMVDAVGSRPLLRKHKEQIKNRGIQLVSLLPVNLFRRRLARIDIRNHRKIVVIDGNIGYTGSQNIVNPSYGHKDIVWHDLMVRLTGPIVLELQSVLVTDWYAETHEELNGPMIFPDQTATGNDTILALPSGPTYHEENFLHLIVAGIYRAHDQIILTSPYFVPEESLLRAIEVARLRGVKVVMILPERSDQILVSAAQRAYYRELLDLGVEIHLFQPGLIHSKTLTIDGQFASVGTSNFDIRSFALNLELNLIFFFGDVIQKIIDEQKQYLAQSRRLTLDEWRQRPFHKNLLERLAKLLSPLL